MGAKGPDGREVVLQNLSVKINPDEVSESPLCDYLRIYYCDTLGKAPAPEFLSKDQRTIDIEVLCRWLLDNTPRTRVDALPYLILTKDVLRRFLSRDITIVSERERRLQLQLDQARQELTNTQMALRESQQRGQELEAALEAARAQLEAKAQVRAAAAPAPVAPPYQKSGTLDHKP